MSNTKITHVSVRMYCMGTGDCFIIKFFSGEIEKFKMMIDCGVWKGSKEHITPFIINLKEHVNNSLDLLVITHEHVDHVSVFETCHDLFTNDFDIKKIWFGWTENDNLDEVKKWKKEYGEKKKALAIAAEMIESSLNDPQKKEEILKADKGREILMAKKEFADTLKGFADLHIRKSNGEYKGSLEGMRIVKEELATDNVNYLYPGDIIEDIPELEGVKFYILGPPENWENIDKESGGAGESYSHNKDIKGVDAFSVAVLNQSRNNSSILPFDEQYETEGGSAKDIYNQTQNSWRTIDDDWLYNAGSLALRMNSLTNNLSLALAIEFNESKKVMLFPGDAEYGSWASWHQIDWGNISGAQNKHFTEDLLNRTVFYKVAHHMSHNGTAQRLGLEMMKHKDLTAMATLDYKVIAPKWKNTMPNRAMLKELLKRTKGRLLVMNENELFYDFNEKEPLHEKIAEARKKMNSAESNEFQNNLNINEDRLFIEYTINI